MAPSHSWKSALSLCALSVIVALVFVSIDGSNAQKALPLVPLVGGEYNSSMYWGSYRPGIYFGMKSRSASPISTGVMWGSSDNFNVLRHQCNHNDKLQKYGWISHDGEAYGEHEVIDTPLNLRIHTLLYKHNPNHQYGGSWVNRFSAYADGAGNNEAVTFMFYVTFPSACTIEPPRNKAKSGPLQEVLLNGYCPETGYFTLVMGDASKVNKPPYYNDLTKNLRGVPDLTKTHYMARHIADPEKAWRVREDLVEPALKASHSRLFMHYMTWRQENPDEAKDAVDHHARPLLVGTLPNEIEPNSNVWVFQRVFQPPFEWDVILVNHAAHAQGQKTPLSNVKLIRVIQEELSGEGLNQILYNKKVEFNRRFRQTFGGPLPGKDEPEEQRLQLQPHREMSSSKFRLARAAFSNMLGGLGYFHGSSIIGETNPPALQSNAQQQQIQPQEQLTLSEPGPLFTAVPSRPFFPRGFLWDEGFHQLLLSLWQPRLSFDVLAHWLNRQTAIGWIPREQILGEEARSRVPTEFQVQRPSVANPPTFFLTLHQLMHQAEALFAEQHQQVHQRNDDAVVIKDGTQEDSLASYLPTTPISWNEYVAFFSKALPRLVRWYDWLAVTQRGIKGEFSYRWRGRTENHTLASGLDDYPRARFPSDSELHLDLLCWQALAARTLHDLTFWTTFQIPPPAFSISAVDRSNNAELAKYKSDYAQLLGSLQTLHWDAEAKRYSDVEKIEADSTVRFSQHVGYISLFPLALGLLDPQSQQYEIGQILSLIEDDKKLWTPYGLRSLSAEDPLYGKGENYWRGPIWINVNYLVLSALKNHYWTIPNVGSSSEELQERIHRIYNDLRNNIVNNIDIQYKKTGYIWEQYDPKTGNGKGTHPFTGWSALVVNILAEKYY